MPLPDSLFQPSTMFKMLLHWWYLFRATLWSLLAFARSAHYFHHKSWSDLKLPHAGYLSSKEKRRLKHYFYGTTYLSIIFGSLHGRLRSADEKNQFSNLSALAYFFDDLVDDFRQRGEQHFEWKNNPETYGYIADDHRKLSLHFLDNIYQIIPQQYVDEFKSYMFRVFNVETAGRQNHNHQLNFNELYQITAEKGGYSVLLFRRILNLTMTDAEKEALFQFGMLIQLCDDIFDIWFDVQNQTQTLAVFFVRQQKTADLCWHFEQQVQRVARAFRAIGLPNRQKETALRVVHFLTSVTRICLKHYLTLEKNRGTLPLNNRQLMVVDMEKWNNRLRAALILVFKTI